MPHAQKEKHDHSTFSKKKKDQAKQDKVAKKQAQLDLETAAAEAGKKTPLPNSLPLVEGFGEYEIGCEPEREYNFNKLKRSKKHLRNDIRRNQEREEEEKREEERRLQEAAHQR